MAKYLAAELAIKCADRAIQTHGGYGFSEEYGIIHYWTTTRLMRTAPISVISSPGPRPVASRS